MSQDNYESVVARRAKSGPLRRRKAGKGELQRGKGRGRLSEPINPDLEETKSHCMWLREFRRNKRGRPIHPMRGLRRDVEVLSGGVLGLRRKETWHRDKGRTEKKVRDAEKKRLTFIG